MNMPFPCRTFRIAAAIIAWTIVASVVVVGRPVETRGAEPKLLRWKFVAGDSWRVNFQQKVTTDSSFGGKPLKLSVDTTLGQTWKVDSVAENGAAVITQSFDRIAVTMDLPPAAPLAFDSTSKRKPSGDAKVIADQLLPLLGPTFRITMSPRGELLDVEPSAELDKALSGLSDDTRLKRLFSKTGLHDVLRQSLTVLPENAVEPSATWDQTAELDSAVGRVQLSTTYTYEGQDTYEGAKVERLGTTGKLTWKPARAELTNSRELKDQKQTGFVLFDAAAGRMVAVEQQQTLRSEARVRDTLLEVRLTSELKISLR